MPVRIDGKEVRLGNSTDHQIRYDSGAAMLYIEDGEVAIRAAQLSLEDVRLNGRVLPRWLKSVILQPGDDLVLGDKTFVHVEIPKATKTKESANPEEAQPRLPVKMGRNRATIKTHRLTCLGIEATDTRAMFKWDGKSLIVSPSRQKDLIFVWNQKGNYLFPYQWYRVTDSDELRVGGVSGALVDFPRTELEKEISPLKVDSQSETPLMFVESERIRSLVARQIELEQQAPPPKNYELAGLIEHLLSLNASAPMSRGWRLRQLATINERNFFFARRLEDEYPAMVEFTIPDPRQDPREYHERSDFVLSTICHPHIVKAIAYGTVANPGNPHGPFHVRILERFSGVGLLSILKHCVRFDARTTLSIMIPIIDGLNKATSAGSTFTPSPYLIQSEEMFRANSPVARAGEGGAFIAGRFSISQIWLCPLADGRVTAKVDCHAYRFHTDTATSEAKDLQKGHDAVSRIGLVLHKLITGRSYRPDSSEPSDLTDFDRELEEIALRSITGDTTTKPESISALRDLLEVVWRKIYLK